ncbi:cysteine desulfurase [Virgibacillus phasianinus]|uniref:Cysteine desulfurase n=1 Tax=Virgibacillus phasianinus TaxID=2017483 RepID=A0A220U3A7_9BACI|nr:IscS subfamily cysteine desulfurase [Virgibacillus phasianinus]ASK62580.1 cysteine desulfurase [Virgibacillus phasianinus]
MIYLDYAATTPMSEESLDIFNQVSKSFFGNPNSMHDVGSRASRLLDTSRKELAALLDCPHQGIYFTSGGSESNILALSSLIDAHNGKGNHLITTISEHSSVYHFFKKMENAGFDVTYLPLDEHGQVQLDSVRKAIRKTTILASIQYGNSEIGTIHPIESIGTLLHQHQILFHCDAVQAFGKVPISLTTLKIDSLSISSHKLYGPKGVGAVYINPEVKWQAQITNTTHEMGFRPGTVNVPGIAAFVTSAIAVCNDRIKEQGRIDSLRSALMNELKQATVKSHIEGHPTDYLPHILGLRIDGMEGQYVMLEGNRYGIAISTGSACQVGKQEPSRTMKALGYSDSSAKQFIRLSFGKHTTTEDIGKTAETLRYIINKFLQSKGG